MKQTNIRYIVNGIFYKTSFKVEEAINSRNVFIISNFDPGWIKTGNLFSEESIFFDVRINYQNLYEISQGN